MKTSSVILLALWFASYTSTRSAVNKQEKSASAYRKANDINQPQQFKVFHNGQYSFVLYDPEGAFHFPGAHDYVAENNVYKEFFLYLPDTSIPTSIEWKKWN